jgi:WD40 repeat protein
MRCTRTMNKMTILAFLSICQLASLRLSESVSLAQEMKLWRTLEFERNPRGNETRRDDNKSMQSIRSLAFSFDNKKLASVTVDQIRLWDMATGKSIAIFSDDPLCCVAFSPNGKTLATGTGGNDPPDVLIWDVASGKEIARLKGHQQDVSAAAFAPNGKVLATGCAGGTIRIWDTTSLKNTATLQHEGHITCVAFANGGRM